MKRILNYLSILITVIALNAVAVSCGSNGSEESDDNNLLISLKGSWELQLITINADGQSYNLTMDDLKDDPEDPFMVDQTLTFSGQKVNNYPFKIDGNRLMLPWYEELGWWAEVSFSGSKKMTLYYDVVVDGIQMKIWSYYVKTRSNDINPGLIESSDLIRSAVRAINKDC